MHVYEHASVNTSMNRSRAFVCVCVMRVRSFVCLTAAAESGAANLGDRGDHVLQILLLHTVKLSV